MNNDTVSPDQDAGKGASALRVLVLGSLYALAVLFAVMFAPSMNVAPHHPAGEAGSVASVEPPVRR